MAKKKERVYQLPAESKLLTLLKNVKSYGNKVAEFTGELREKIARAVEKDHLHKKAFAHARVADKMEAEELALYFAHRDHYEKVLELRERAESAPELPTGDGDEKETGDEKVTRPRPALVRREAEGASADVG